MHQIFWYAARKYPRTEANQILKESCGAPPLPENPDPDTGVVENFVTWDEIQSHAKRVGIVCSHIQNPPKEANG